MPGATSRPIAPAAAPQQADEARRIDLIVIHCSATPNGRWFSTLDIDQWHAERDFKRRGEWRARQNAQLGSIGYHFVVYINGAIATGRHLGEVGAHVVGNNRTSIGICVIGTDKFTRAQWSSLAALVDRLRQEFPDARVTGHRDLSPDKNNDGLVEPWEWLKTCPGFEVAAWRASNMLPPAGHVLEEGEPLGAPPRP